MDGQATVERAMQLLHAEYGADLIGVLAGGSLLRGEGDRHSDIDVVVVIASPRRRRWNVMIDGVEIEMFVNPPFQMRRYFEEDRQSGRGVQPHLCSTGRIVFDPQGVMAALQAEAHSIWHAGPSALSERDRWQFRYAVADGLRDIEDVEASDKERAVLLIGALLPQIIDQHYRISGRWLHKRKRVLDDLAHWDPAACSLARRACNDGTASGERLTAVRALAAHVLAPIGGVMPLEWSTNWEELDPIDAANRTTTEIAQNRREHFIASRNVS